ncbi:DUF4340 domain-containing protein [Methylophaga sp. OBS3]|uniref:DUF4340 domain-containing protein n=1 Tax=Methylophaga sp. OBS3 TaxID=2991934 RepID=UPI002254BE35|nr:DUF4340 domain-containing protein [Methylophaga sp. OBS3]MCX4190587.1 DUF4340 domain-containing protein [Methylophaga sp. OBS3]
MLKKLNSLTILAILTGVMVLLMLITIYQSTDDTDDFALLYPDLFEQLADVDKLTFEGREGKFTLLRDGDEDWVVKEYYNYPADFDLVKRMLIDIADAKILEDKTDDPEEHYILGVDTNELGSSDALEIKMYNGDDEIAGVVLGNTRDVTVQTGPRQTYVRRSGEQESWLAEGYLQISPVMLNWINGQIVDIARERIAQVDITQPNGESVTLINLGQKDKFGTPEDLDKTIFKYEQLGYDIAGSLFQLRLEDVTPIAEFDRGEADVVTAEFLTYDGLKITTKTSFIDGFYYTTLNASFDAAATQNVPASIAELDVLKDRQAVEQEIAELNERFADWAYRVGGFVGTNLMRARADVVTERERQIPMPMMPGGGQGPLMPQ